MEDKDIIALFLQRNESAIRHTERKYSAYLLKIAFNILNNTEDSSECVNDTYLKAWNAIPPQQPEKLSCFLGKITRELSIDALRKKLAAKRAGEYMLSLDELSECVSGNDGAPEQQADRYALSEAISAYLRTCSEDARCAFVSRYFFCDSVKSIADSYEMSESKVKSILFRTRAGLKKYLEKEGFSV